MLPKREVYMTKLLLSARVQHTRLTLEELPVGSITLNEHGVIETVDKWTEKQLEFKCTRLVGSSITTLFGDGAFDFVEALQSAAFGSVWQKHVRTKYGALLDATMVLTQSLEPGKFIFSVIYTTSA